MGSFQPLFSSHQVNPPKRLRAYPLAPIATFLCMGVIGTIESVYRMMAGIPTFNEPSTETLIMVGLIIGVPLLYIGSVLVGVPVVWWLERHDKVSLRHFALAGLLCGLVLAGGLTFPVSSSKNDELLQTFAILLLLLVGPVTLGSVSWWYIGYRTHNKKS